MSSLLLRTSFVAAMVLGLPLADLGRQERRAIGVTEGFDAYARGEYDHIADAIARVQDRIGFARELQRQAPAWIEATGPEHVPQRRLVVAAVALEAALAMPVLRAEATKAIDLVQWACALVRRNPGRSDAEYWWHRTGLAVLQRIAVAGAFPGLVPGSRGSGDRRRNPLREVLLTHISHSESRYPDDPAWRLATAEATEFGTWGVVTPPGPRAYPAGAGFNENQARLAVRAYQSLLTHEVIGAEAHLRTAYLAFRMGNLGTVTRHLNQAEASTRDPLLLYLAALVRAQAFERAGDLDAAADAYEAALHHWSGAESAATALAAIRFQQGRREEAQTLTETALQQPASEDPWRFYGRGDYRLRDLMGRLRDAVTGGSGLFIGHVAPSPQDSFARLRMVPTCQRTQMHSPTSHAQSFGAQKDTPKSQQSL